MVKPEAHEESLHRHPRGRSTVCHLGIQSQVYWALMQAASTMKGMAARPKLDRADCCIS